MLSPALNFAREGSSSLQPGSRCRGARRIPDSHPAPICQRLLFHGVDSGRFPEGERGLGWFVQSFLMTLSSKIYL